MSNELAKEERPLKDVEKRMAALREIQARWAALPDLDTRTADEIIGYDENGLPT